MVRQVRPRISCAREGFPRHDDGPGRILVIGFQALRSFVWALTESSSRVVALIAQNAKAGSRIHVDSAHGAHLGISKPVHKMVRANRVVDRCQGYPRDPEVYQRPLEGDGGARYRNAGDFRKRSELIRCTVSPLHETRARHPEHRHVRTGLSSHQRWEHRTEVFFTPETANSVVAVRSPQSREVLHIGGPREVGRSHLRRRHRPASELYEVIFTTVRGGVEQIEDQHKSSLAHVPWGHQRELPPRVLWLDGCLTLIRTRVMSVSRRYVVERLRGRHTRALRGRGSAAPVVPRRPGPGFSRAWDPRGRGRRTQPTST